ncbi:MAG: PIG-L family deacetylase [Acholeplasmataceae bacterium]|nr:PIG-L family deacetylase [Acholeplasmataceae bacterium]
MKLNKKTAEFFIPDQTEVMTAIKKTTHMSIAAHQDDIEIMAYDGILQCFGKEDQSFFGVVVTSGSGSARDSLYKNYTDQEMINVRRLEQKKAAYIGEFGALALLDYPSAETKDPKNTEIIDELAELIKLANPEILYTHNLADKHDTHIGVTTKVIKAIRKLPANLRPKKVYGCEVWRDLDWMLDDEKVIFDVSGHPNLAQALVEVFDSQIIGGKRYDLATTGRRVAHATYSTSHAVDKATALIFAMDLTPLVTDINLDIKTYVLEYIERFKQDVSNRIQKML